jgi:hypothetical protein
MRSGYILLAVLEFGLGLSLGAASAFSQTAPLVPPAAPRMGSQAAALAPATPLAQAVSPPDSPLPDPTSPADPGLLQRARETAADAAKTFKESLQGRTVTVGATRTMTDLNLYYYGQPAAIETYRGDDYGYALGMSGTLKEQGTLGAIGGGWTGLITFGLTGNYGTFSLRQSLQQTAAGETAQGHLAGDYLYILLQERIWLLRESNFLPVGIGLWAGMGQGFIRYRAPLIYTAKGSTYQIEVRNDGLYPRIMFAATVELRLGNFLLSDQALEFTGGNSVATCCGGRKFFIAEHSVRIDVYTLAYVFNF